MSGNEAFEFVTERGWTRGLPTMLRSGLAHWFKTRMWWTQCLIWSLVICGILAAVAFSRESPPGDELAMLFTVFAGLFPAVGVIIIMQDALVGEKREGTAAWVLSKPLTRPAFVVSKIVANSLGILVTMVVVPCLLAFVVLSASPLVTISASGYIAALGIVFISHFYFLSLTLMLGALFNSRGPVIGIPLAILFMQQNLISFLPSLRFVLQWSLVISLGNTNSLAFSLLSGTPIARDMIITLAAILVESILFILVGIWRFNREEF
jgi:ABC-2 type transport system permease protein